MHGQARTSGKSTIGIDAPALGSLGGQVARHGNRTLFGVDAGRLAFHGERAARAALLEGDVALVGIDARAVVVVAGGEGGVTPRHVHFDAALEADVAPHGADAAVLRGDNLEHAARHRDVAVGADAVARGRADVHCQTVGTTRCHLCATQCQLFDINGSFVIRGKGERGCGNIVHHNLQIVVASDGA